MNKFLVRYFILIFFIPFVGKSQGLLFNSNDNLIADRTSYNVFAHTIPEFDSDFTLDFDLSILDPGSFGYICHIKDQNKPISYSLAYVSKDEKSCFLKFNLDGKENLLTIPLEKEKLGFRKWQNVSFHFNLINKIITVDVNGVKHLTRANKFDRFIKPEINFGKHGSIIDVPAFAIKDLTIKSKNKIYSFAFNESKGNDVYDTKGVPYGQVKNPNWLINESYHWKPRYTFSSKKVAAVNFDEKNQRMIILNSDSIVFYNFQTNAPVTHRYKNELEVPIRLGCTFIDSTKKRLYVYEVNDIPAGAATIASLHLDSLRWQINSNLQLPQQRHHHNSVWDVKNQNLVIFGGFGNQKLTNSFNSYDIKSNQWNEMHFTGDTISPRFFSGLTKLTEKELLIFGGTGNNTGDQSIGKTYYYDCYKVNLANKSIKKLWNVTRNDVKMVSTRNMILAQDTTSFYTLCYPEYIPNSLLRLYKYSVKNGEYEILGDSIPILSERIRTNANLYFNAHTNELYCTVHEFEFDGTSVIRVYSLSKPPVSREVINQYNSEINYSTHNYLLWGLGLGLGILFLYFLFRIIINGRLKSLKEQKEIIKKNTATEVKIQKKNNSVYLFGEFIVIDKAGKDISYLFRPKIKLLFLLFLLNSKKDDDGVTSNQIYSTLWPESPTQNAKNSKNVTINQLRKVINDVDGIELMYNNGYYLLETTEHFYCDYFELLSLAKELTKEIQKDDTLLKLITIVSTGPFLKSVDDEYFDNCKKEFEIEILKTIPFQTDNYYKAQNYVQTIQLAEILYYLDSLNETAFYYKIHSYLKLGMTDKAKKHFNSYIVEYKKVLNEDFPYTFREISKNIPIEEIKNTLF